MTLDLLLSRVCPYGNPGYLCHFENSLRQTMAQARVKKPSQTEPCRSGRFLVRPRKRPERLLADRAYDPNTFRGGFVAME